MVTRNPYPRDPGGGLPCPTLPGGCCQAHLTLTRLAYGPCHTLKKANKNFDMFLLPNADHRVADGYILRRMWDYLVTHLLEREPPEDFELVRGVEISVSEMESE